MTLRTAGLIIIGNEILSGRVKDNNIYFLTQRFHDLGVKVDKIVTVGDVVQDIAEEVKDFSDRFDLVITCGGIGPTCDDVTYDGVASAFNLELKVNDELALFWKEDPNVNEISIKKMSSVPVSSKLVYAETDSIKVPVIAVFNVFMFPGTPQFLQSRFTALESQYFSGNGTKFYKREIFLIVGEPNVLSALNETVNLFRDVTIGSYPEIDNPDYFTRITLHGHDEHRVSEAYNMLVSLIEPSWIIDPSKFSTSSPNYKSKI